MLELIIPGVEYWDEEKQEFVYGEEQTLKLEHSLVSLSKWESKHHKAFLSNKEKTAEETLDYIKYMTITPNVNPEVYKRLTNDHVQQINEYIAAPMTATVINKEPGKGKGSKETVTAELIYYWMMKLGIWEKCEKWHLNRLMTLIEVFNVKDAPPKKRSQRDIMSRNAALNEARRKQLGTKG